MSALLMMITAGIAFVMFCSVQYIMEMFRTVSEELILAMIKSSKFIEVPPPGNGTQISIEEALGVETPSHIKQMCQKSRGSLMFTQ